jgi:hypothetical protein
LQKIAQTILLPSYGSEQTLCIGHHGREQRREAELNFLVSNYPALQLFQRWIRALLEGTGECTTAANPSSQCGD